MMPRRPGTGMPRPPCRDTHGPSGSNTAASLTGRSALAGALLLLAPGAFAQGSGDASPLDAKFLARTAQGSAYELASAKLAAEKASRAEVGRYAAKLASDHDDFNGALQQLARAKGVPARSCDPAA